jgi:hypothetical protein
MVSSLRPSDHPVLLSSLPFLCNSSDATRKWTVNVSFLCVNLEVLKTTTNTNTSIYHPNMATEIITLKR